MSCTVCIPGGERCSRHRMSDRFVLSDDHETLTFYGRTLPLHGVHVSTSGDIASFDGCPMETRRARVITEPGVVVSIVWGSMTYSSNHSHPYEDRPFFEEPSVVEVATWFDREGYNGDRDPVGYCTPEAVSFIIDRANRGLLTSEANVVAATDRRE